MHLYYLNIFGTFRLQDFHRCSILQGRKQHEGVNVIQITPNQVSSGHLKSVFAWFSPRWPESVSHFTRNGHEGLQAERISTQNVLCGRFDTQIKVPAHLRSQGLFETLVFLFRGHFSQFPKRLLRALQTICAVNATECFLFTKEVMQQTPSFGVVG